MNSDDHNLFPHQYQVQGQHSTAIRTWTDLTDKIDTNSFIYLYLYHFPFASHDTLDAHT